MRSVLLGCVFLMGCGPTCRVIRVLDTGCAVFVWTDAQGREHRVKMDHDELIMHAREVEMARAAKR